MIYFKYNINHISEPSFGYIFIYANRLLIHSLSLSERKLLVGLKRSKCLNMKVGAYFWYGFSKWDEMFTDRLLNVYSDRCPTWGWVSDTQENFEYQIDLAADNNISFFAIDWYNSPYMGEYNRAVDMFLKAKNADRMEFCLMVANHAGAEVRLNEWKPLCEKWLLYLSDPHALKVDGKPVIIFFLVHDLEEQLGGAESAKRCFDYLNELMVKNGFPGINIIGCVCPYGSPGFYEIDYHPEWFNEHKWQEDIARYKWEGYSALTGYNYRKFNTYDENGKLALSRPFSEMTMQHEDCWDVFCRYNECGIKYIPPILSGYDARPWDCVWKCNPTGKRQNYCVDRKPETLYNHAVNAGLWLEKNKKYTMDDIAIVYAWNEYGEGAYVAPTVGDPDAKYLRSIKDAVDLINRKRKK